ncbi:hypothetical protein Tco_1414925, partial [Tanacetum coccineum]
AGESVATPEICCLRRKHRCGAQKVVATAAEHLVLPDCDHILDTFSAHPPS